MATQIASIFASGVSFSVPAFILLTLIVALWAVFLPAAVRDADRRPLPPNITARLLFVFIYVLLYVALVAGFAIGGETMVDVGAGDEFQTILSAFKGQEPLMAITILAGLHSLSHFRELENSLIIWLHSARHLNNDIQTLSNHLQECSFEPTPGEKQKNLSYLREFDVYVTDSGNSALHLEAVNAWRKTSSLLRALRAWASRGGDDVLMDDDLKVLSELERAHRRKTRLAMDIIRMLELVERGGVSANTVTNLALLLASASHKDRDEVTQIENRLKEMLGEGGEDDSVQRPMRLTSRQLQNYLSQIESYFRVEYKLLLQQASELTAKAVVLAGDDAPERLIHIKSIGFGQLGQIRPINFDRILWLFFAVALGGFLVLTLWPRTQDAPQLSADLYARIAVVTALASLVGAVVGSNRKLAARSETPWSHYLMAGVIAAMMFVMVHGAAYMLRHMSAGTAAKAVNAEQSVARTNEVAPGPSGEVRVAEEKSVAEPSAGTKTNDGRGRRGPPEFVDILPWAASPFFLAIAICWLARLPRWPRPPPFPEVAWERIMDGLSICAVMTLAQATAYALHLGLKTSMAPMLLKRISEFSESGSMILYILRPNPGLLLGFLVGAIVIRDVREAAHSRLTDQKALRAYALAEEDARNRGEELKLTAPVADSGDVGPEAEAAAAT